MNEPTDGRPLLRAGAAQPRGPLDVEAILRRGAVRRRRRRLRRGTAAVALLLVVVVTGVWAGARERPEPRVILAPGPTTRPPTEASCPQGRRLRFNQFTEGPLLADAFGAFAPPEHPHEEGAQPAILQLHDAMSYDEARDAAARVGPGTPDELVLAAYVPTVAPVWLALWHCEGESGADLAVALDPSSGVDVARSSTAAVAGQLIEDIPMSAGDAVLLRGKVAGQGYVVSAHPEPEGSVCVSLSMFRQSSSQGCGLPRVPGAASEQLGPASYLLEEEDPEAWRHVVYGSVESGTALVATGTDLGVRAPATAQPTYVAFGMVLYAVEAAQDANELAAYDADGERIALFELDLFPPPRVEATVARTPRRRAKRRPSSSASRWRTSPSRRSSVCCRPPASSGHRSS